MERIIKYLSHIDRRTQEGRLLLAALAKLTTESQTDKTPEEVILQLHDLANEMFKDSRSDEVGNCDHAGAMYLKYKIHRPDVNGHEIWFGVNKCSRCGYEEEWQYDI